MKKLYYYLFLTINLVIFFIAIFCIIPKTNAGEIIDNDTLYWDWCGPTPEGTGLETDHPIANDLAWHLFIRKENESYNYESPTLIIPYDGDYNLTYDLPIDGIGGTNIKLYFVLRASYNGAESDDSNEISKEVIIPRDKVLQLRFNITVN